MSAETMDYVITLHQVHLFKTTKHWDSFVSHCTLNNICRAFVVSRGGGWNFAPRLEIFRVRNLFSYKCYELEINSRLSFISL